MLSHERFDSKLRYLALFSSAAGIEKFFSFFYSNRIKCALAILDESSSDISFEKIMYGAIPIVRLVNSVAGCSVYGLKHLKFDTEREYNVFNNPAEIEDIQILECSKEEFDAAPSEAQFLQIIIPPAQISGQYFKLNNSKFAQPSYVCKEADPKLSVDVLKSKSVNKTRIANLLDNPNYPVCTDISRFITELSSLREVTQSVQDTFLEIIDEILGWSRNHDPTPFPGTFGIKNTLQMYHRLFQEFELRVKNCPKDSAASRTFDIALKKITPCTRSLKRQLLRISVEEPTWLCNAKQFAFAEARDSHKSVTKRQKSDPNTAEGTISMPLLVPYLDVEWPSFKDSPIESSYLLALKKFETHLLDQKLIGQ